MQEILNYFREKINTFVRQTRNLPEMLQNKDIFVSLIIILVAFGSFGLGRLSKIEDIKEPITVEDISAAATASLSKNTQATAVKANQPSQEAQAGKKFVASKNGTKYYLSWCSGVSRISEANKIWFATKEEAERRGLTPAANCPGI